MKFESIVGQYLNKKQAFSYPSQYAMIRIVSEVKFNETQYIAKDAGYNEEGKLVFGKDSGGPFIFDRL